MTMRGFETVGVKAVIQGLPEYLAGAKAITQANVGIGGSLKGAESLTASFKLLAAAMAGVTAAIGVAAVASAAKYETQLAKIDALTNTSAEDTDRLGKALLNMSKTVPKSPNELGAAAYFALSSGIGDVNDALALVNSAAKASAAGLGSTADIVDIVTAAMNAYGHENLSAAKATDILVATVREGKGEPAQMANALGTLLPIAAALKIPFEDLAATFASLTNALGGSDAAHVAATQLRGILSQLASPSKEAKDALAEQEAGVKHLSASEIELADAHNTVATATESLIQAQRGVRDAQEGVVQAQRGVRDSQQAASDAQRDARNATDALKQAYTDLAAAQRNQIQASLDSRRETLSVLEAEQGLRELRAQQGNQATEVAAAELALAQAREQASSKGKKTALEQQQANLAVTQAEQRLNQVRVQGPRYALDLQNAELRLSDARLRVGTAQKQQDKEVADRQKNVVKATQDVTDAHRAEVKANEGVVDSQHQLRNAYEGVDDAGRNVTRQQAELALAQEKEVLAVIHSRDAYTDLRKEIAEKGLVPTLQRINDLFADNQEGLAKLFPDVRAFTGFLSAISSQGAQTATILDRIKKSAGITDEAFNRMSKTFNFQKDLLKNQLNVGLIQLGSLALPSVTSATEGLLKVLPSVQATLEGIASSLPGVFAGINNALSQSFGQIAGGSFKTDFFAGIVKSAKDAGDAVGEFARVFSLGLSGGDIGGEIGSVQQALFDLGAFIRDDAIPAFTDATEAVRLFFLGLAGGEVGGEIGTLQQSLFDLGTTVRQQWLEVIQPAIQQASTAIIAVIRDQVIPTITTLADIVATTVKAINDNWSTIRDVLEPVFKSMVATVTNAFAIFGAQLKVLQAFVQGVDDLIHGRWAALWDDAKDFVSAAFDVVTKIIETQVLEMPKRFIALGLAVAGAAASAGASIGKAFGNGIIDAINRMLNSLGGRVIIPAIRLAGREISPEVRLPQINNPIPRLAQGDVVNKPTFALIGEAGPEAVLPLSDPQRSRQIVSMLSPGFVNAIMPKAYDEGGLFGQLSGYRQPTAWDAYNQYFAPHPIGGLVGATGSDVGDGGGDSVPIGGGSFGGTQQTYSSGPDVNDPFYSGVPRPGSLPSKQFYATLPPSLIRSMSPPSGNSGVSFASLFGGDINIGSTSAEVEALVVQQIHSLFSRARSTTNLTGSLITGSVG